MDDRIALSLTSHASRLFSPSFSRLPPLAQIFQKKKELSKTVFTQVVIKSSS